MEQYYTGVKCIESGCVKAVTKSAGWRTEEAKMACFIRGFSWGLSREELCAKVKRAGVITGGRLANNAFLYFAWFWLQCHEMVVRGQLPACEEDLQTLAALRLQFLMGDFGTHAPCPPLDELFPSHVLEARVLVSLSSAHALSPCPLAAQGCHSTQRFTSGLLAGALWSHTATAAHKQKMKQDIRLRSRLKEEVAAVMGSILERWRGLAGYGCRDSIAAYLTIARQWPGFGCTLYEVDFYIVSPLLLYHFVD